MGPLKEGREVLFELSMSRNPLIKEGFSEPVCFMGNRTEVLITHLKTNGMKGGLKLIESENRFIKPL